ncbi:prepilin-type N-terminal cleavage/methylation domain-containing protein [Candidatus Babeliales bacterium]|nr:prepilin-type N-terminal cleavage/methylation domain-containing protein [Candidatus Babeliales bacterium]
MNKPSFTLIELMIVVAIIAFLASIAMPRYFSYYAKAKQAEVTMLLASLHTAQQAHWAEHGAYSTKLTGPDGIGWQPEGYSGGGANSKFHYTYGFNSQNAQEGVTYFTGKLQAPAHALGNSYADKEKFLAKAAGDVTGKNKMDVWSIDESRNIKHEQNGV